MKVTAAEDVLINDEDEEFQAIDSFFFFFFLDSSVPNHNSLCGKGGNAQISEII